MDGQTKEFAWLVDEEKKGILGSMDEHGTVTFAIEAGESSSIRGTTFFNAMMDDFGEDAKAIHGVWLKGDAKRKSTNIDKVNELTAAGLPVAEAVLQAWTVTRAKRRGFTKVRVLGIPEGQPGRYTRIDVLIEK